MERVLLSVKRFKQLPAECAICATASLASFFDGDVDYDSVRSMLKSKERKGGLYTSQQGRLLNKLGFESVSIVTADLNLVDFSWANYTKKSIIRKMKTLRAYYKRQEDLDSFDYVDDMVRWLDDEDYDNNIVIDYEFKKYIKRQLDRGVPVGAAVNWTSLFKFQKGNRKQKNSDIRGDQEDHAIVLRGYDEKGVFVVDSHTECYRGKRAKYRRGYYKLAWDKFLVNIPGGDLILV